MKIWMPVWNWSSVEMRARSGAELDGVGNSPGEGGEEAVAAADELVAGLGAGAGPGNPVTATAPAWRGTRSSRRRALERGA